MCAYFAPAFVYGGPPRSIFGLCRAQRDAGVDVRVITTTANGDSELSDAVVARGEYEGIPVRYCARAWPRSIFHAPSLGAAVAAALRDADVLHIHGLWNAAVWSAAAAARQERKPYVLSPRGMLAPAALAHDKWRKKLVYPLADRRVIRDAARLHATSRGEFEALDHLPEAGRAVYVPNGVELPPGAVQPGLADLRQLLAALPQRDRLGEAVPALLEASYHLDQLVARLLVRQLLAGVAPGVLLRHCRSLR